VELGQQNHKEDSMKRLFLILVILLFASVSYAGGMSMIVAGGGSGGIAKTYCTGATTCTATTPGSCDVACEDFEGATECATGYESVCRRATNYWTPVVTAENTVTFASTPAGTTGLCADRGTGAAKLTTIAASTNAALAVTFASNLTDLYAEFYFNINSITIADATSNTLFLAFDNGGSNGVAINLRGSGTNTVLRSTCTGGTSTNDTTVLAKDGSTWYRVGLSIIPATNTYTIYLNGTQILQDTGCSGIANVKYMRFGPSSTGFYSATAMVLQLDNISFSTSTLPGGCNL
jgi:hypothetical protein